MINTLISNKIIRDGPERIQKAGTHELCYLTLTTQGHPPPAHLHEKSSRK